MTSNSPSSELNLSKRGVGFPYYQEELKLIWTDVKRSPIYEYDNRILLAGNYTMNEPKSKMGRKPGGRNQK